MATTPTRLPANTMQTDFQAYISAHEVDFIRFKTNLFLDDAGKDPIKRAGLIATLCEAFRLFRGHCAPGVHEGMQSAAQSGRKSYWWPKRRS